MVAGGWLWVGDNRPWQFMHPLLAHLSPHVGGAGLGGVGGSVLPGRTSGTLGRLAIEVCTR